MGNAKIVMIMNEPYPITIRLVEDQNATNNSLFNLTELAKTVHNSPKAQLMVSDASQINVI